MKFKLVSILASLAIVLFSSCSSDDDSSSGDEIEVSVEAVENTSSGEYEYVVSWNEISGTDVTYDILVLDEDSDFEDVEFEIDETTFTLSESDFILDTESQQVLVEAWDFNESTDEFTLVSRGEASFTRIDFVAQTAE